MNAAGAPACHVCEAVASPAPGSVVLDEDAWLAYNIADVPGWIMLASREHVEGAAGLGDGAASSFGPIARRIDRAVRAATGAERVHLVFLGDTARHFHLGFFPRQAGESGLFDTARLGSDVGALKDPERAAPITAAIAGTLAAS